MPALASPSASMKVRVLERRSLVGMVIKRNFQNRTERPLIGGLFFWRLLHLAFQYDARVVRSQPLRSSVSRKFERASEPGAGAHVFAVGRANT
jgi:hypothetical protein